MSEASVIVKWSSLPGLRRRRVHVCGMLILLIVLLLGLQAVLPEWPVLPPLAGHPGAGIVLFVFLAAFLCEYIDSSLGMGYGTTLTPLLMLAGFEPLEIVPCVLFSEFITGLSAGLMHHRDGNVNWSRNGRARGTAILLSVLSTAGALAAVTVALHVPKSWLESIIAFIILSVGVTVLATIRRQLRYRRGHIVAVGAIAAFNKGLSGGGYGPLVTAGQVVSGISPKHAVAITSLAESFTCLVGLVAYGLCQAQFDWTLALPLTLGAVLSVPLATLTVRRLPENILRAGVGAVTCLLGLITVIKVVW